MNTIRAKLGEKLGVAKARAIDVNTIDGFQGREKDVCVFSVVRAPQDSARARARGLGFVADERRVNVGLARARGRLPNGVGGEHEATRLGRFSRARDREKLHVTPTKPYTAFFTKHTKEPDADAGADADRETSGASLGRAEQVARARPPAPPLRKKHIHDPHWTGAAEFRFAPTPSTTTPPVSPRTVSATNSSPKTPRRAAPSAAAHDAAPERVEDGGDAAEDAFTETPDELTRKRPPSRRARASA